MRLHYLAVVLVLVTITFAQQEHIEKLLKLDKLKDLGLVNDGEYTNRKDLILDEYLGMNTQGSGKKYKYFRKVVQPPNNNTGSNWTMPIVWTPQVEWLLSTFEDNMPKSYDDSLPYGTANHEGGRLYWKTLNYLASGAFDYNQTRLPLDDIVAIQERALTHVGLNLYDAGIWGVALSLSGLHPVVDMYQRNVLYTSGTGANPQVGGLKSIRAWEPNPDPESPPDPFYYGRDKVKNTDLKKVQMPGNVSYIKFKDGECQCASAGCCAQEGVYEIPGNFYYRMIGPDFKLIDPLEGYYAEAWRATPAGPNPDPAQYWNYAGIIHWNDWKPITGENVWGIILGPMQVLFLKNCSKITKFATWKAAPYEVQLAVSILPAAEALQSPLGSMYHCPLGTKMYPPDEDEQTNVSNENNFSAWAAFKAFLFVMETYYTGGDATLDEAVKIVTSLTEGLDKWFAANLIPAPINGKLVVSQGGHVSFDGNYRYQQGDQAFAVDCQTWGLLVVGQKRFDAAYASKGVTAYDVWQSAKALAGYYINGQLAGVGYTVPKGGPGNGTLPKPDIWSGEWTWGAVFMARKLSMEYRNIGKTAWADDLWKDAQSMVTFMQKEVIPDDDGVWKDGGLVQIDGSYLYANKRFFIPWGWYANPIGATSSTAWAVCYDFNYNPFMLGGGQNSTFFETQCKDNMPEDGLLEKVLKYYEY